MDNVLIVMPLGEFGGGAERMLATYLSSRTDRQRVHCLFLSAGGLADQAREYGYPVMVIEAGRLRQVGKWVQVQRMIGDIIEKWSIDRILAWMPKAATYLVIPSRLRRTPLYIWRHDIPTQLDVLDKLVLRFGQVRGVACSSGLAQRAFQSCVPGIPTQAIHPSTDPLPVDDRVVSNIRHSLIGDTHGPIIGTIARLQPWKRIDLLLRAGALVKKRYPNLKVMIIGGESHGLSKGYGTELKGLATALLGDSVHFAGEQRNTGDWLDAMDVFVLPSRGEPFGIALVEALASGKPVVACSGGGPEEILTNNTIGRLLSENPTPDEMASAIEGLLVPDARQQAKELNTVEARRFLPTVMTSHIDIWLTDS